MLLSKSKIFIFNKKKDNFVLCSPYMKFLNYLMRKGLKNRFLNFFFNLLRVHKEMVGMFIRRQNYKDYELKKLLRYLEFPFVFKTVARLVSVKVELRYSRLRRKQIAVPTIRAPWKALRLGLSLLLRTAKEKIISAPLNRKTGLLYNLWSEIWNTYHRRSLTASKSVKYVDEVIREIHNYRLSKLYPMRKDRRRVFGLKKSMTIFKERPTIDRYIHGVFRMRMLKRSKKKVYYDIFGVGRQERNLNGVLKKNKKDKKYEKNKKEKRFENYNKNPDSLYDKYDDFFEKNYKDIRKCLIVEKKNIKTKRNRILELEKKEHWAKMLKRIYRKYIYLERFRIKPNDNSIIANYIRQQQEQEE